jgi:hypothetical protein
MNKRVRPGERRGFGGGHTLVSHLLWYNNSYRFVTIEGRQS